MKRTVALLIGAILFAFAMALLNCGGIPRYAFPAPGPSRQFAFVQSGVGVLLMNNDGSGERLAVRGFQPTTAYEAADGTKVVASAFDESNQSQIYYLNLSDENHVGVTQLTRVSGGHGHPRISWDGSKIAFMRYVPGARR